MGRGVYGWKEKSAVEVLKDSFTGIKAKLKMNNDEGQNIQSFQQFFKWFDVAWNIGKLRKKIFNECKNYEIPESDTLKTIVQTYKDKYKLLEQTTQYLNETVKLNTTLTETQQITAIRNALNDEQLSQYNLYIDIKTSTPQTMQELQTRLQNMANNEVLKSIQDLDNINTHVGNLEGNTLV